MTEGGGGDCRGLPGGGEGRRVGRRKAEGITAVMVTASTECSHCARPRCTVNCVALSIYANAIT